MGWSTPSSSRACCPECAIIRIARLGRMAFDRAYDVELSKTFGNMLRALEMRWGPAPH
jgi:hypothetical protein